MTDISVTSVKENLRREKLALRRSMKPEIRDQQSGNIAQNLMKNSQFTLARKIFCYVSLDDEVSTQQILAKAVQIGDVFVPAFQGENIVPAAYTYQQSLRRDRFNIMVSDGPILAPDKYYFDIIIVPGVAFDLHGNRLGMGKGFFDRFLKLARGTTIGLAFEEQVVDKIPTDNYDVPVSFLVTPNSFLSCRPTTTQH